MDGFDSSSERLNSRDEANRRRRKRSRKNSTRACDMCKSRKVRCDGTLPCSRCINQGQNCTYHSKYNRGAHVEPPLIGDFGHEKAGNFNSESRMLVLEPFVSIIQPAQIQPEITTRLLYPHSQAFRSSSPPTVQIPKPGNDKNQDPLQTPDFGSGSFGGATFWQSDGKLEEIDSKFLALPSKKLALKLATWYFDNGCAMYRVLHQPLVKEWIESGFHADRSPFEFDEEPVCQRTPEAEELRRKLLSNHAISAVLFSVWAMGCQFPIDVPKSDIEKRNRLKYQSEQYFLIAQNEFRLRNPATEDLLALQALFLMCLFMMTTSRVKPSWDLLGRIKMVAVNLDLNRKDGGINALGPPKDRLQEEMRRRIFWAIYALETNICTMLGKTLTWSDEDISIDYPAIARFKFLQVVSETNGDEVADALQGFDYGSNEPSVMYSPVAHAKLSRILRRALRLLYNGIPRLDQEDIIDQLAAQVSQWSEELPPFLKLKATAEGLRLPYSKQADTLHIGHAHALIVIHRPSLNLASNFNDTKRPSMTLRRRAHQDSCLAAAISVAEMGDFANLSAANWLIAYVVFCAVTIMFIYLAHNPWTSDRPIILQSARKLCDIEMRISSESDMAKRYVSALKELWHQVRKHIHKSDNESTAASASTGGIMSFPVSPTMEKLSLNIPLYNDHVENLSFDQWESGLEDMQYKTGPRSNVGFFADPVGGKQLFGDLLESLAQSFQGFDSAATAGFD
ncbi:fungal-specific transcription factor domain-containing protein [Lipomyces japonicus]|uniref:fungal-specific transcription factor domain-containing protein n=1 Tax=Lipomyces japonicus TaxID=56871 RepID=UPI0034CEA311